MNLDELRALYDLSGRTSLITGGTGVLGRELAAALYGCNANLILLGRNADAAQKLIESFPKNTKGRVIHVSGDVLDKESLLRAREKVIAEFGVVDILLNAAGGNHPSGTTTPDQSFFDLPQNGLEFVQNLNLLGTILPCQVFGRDMAERGDGVILNVSSMGAYRALTRIPAYSAAKAAVTNFTQWLAVHMAQNYSPR